MTENPYTAPQSAEPTNLPERLQYTELASRWERLGASIVDAIIMMVIAVPIIIAIMFFGFSSETFASEAWLNQIETSSDSIVFELIGVAVVLAVYLAVNGYFLVKSGQTVGKKIVGIQVVDFQTDQLLSPGRIIGMRYILIQVLSSIPLVGSFFGFINILFIFGNEKRCIHDLIANSKVIKKNLA